MTTDLILALENIRALLNPADQHWVDQAYNSLPVSAFPVSGGISPSLKPAGISVTRSDDRWGGQSADTGETFDFLPNDGWNHTREWTEEQIMLSRIVVDDNECWQWLAGKNKKGYGTIKFNGKRVRAHRWMYQHFVGEIPEGLHLDHLCRNRACVNPAHLEPVTCRENILRGESPSALNARKTHCPLGHEYERVTAGERGTMRRCAICARAYDRDRYRAKRAAATGNTNHSVKVPSLPDVGGYALDDPKLVALDNPRGFR